MTLIALNKPFQMMSQFSAHPTRATLADCVDVPGVYPAGRLDADSEGLLLLTDDGALQARIADPQHKLTKTYFAQVEGVPDEAALRLLRSGVDLGDFKTLPAQVSIVDTPAWLWERDPPIRFRAAIPTTWIQLAIREGKNRQVRRMTAAAGYPTLRLIRASMGDVSLPALHLTPGQWCELDVRTLGLAHNALLVRKTKPAQTPRVMQVKHGYKSRPT
ncbi:pseudouridine synthase [Cupriavidus pauculus]|uniref:pseudouridine synthase n=1 Tax=Cupriavidus pauculus TaxID=82633 RepID=UPI0038577D71